MQIASASPSSVAFEDEVAFQASSRRERGRWLRRLWAGRVALGIVFALIWQALGAWVLDRFWISSPVMIGSRVLELAMTGELWRHFWASIEVALYGLVLGTVAGVFIGVILGLAVKVAAVVDPYIMMLYTLPRIALAPLFIMYPSPARQASLTSRASLRGWSSLPLQPW